MDLFPKKARIESPEAHWVAGEDYGRMVSAALSKDLGRGQVVPVQGKETLSLEAAADRFIRAYDPSIGKRGLPFWLLRLAGVFNVQARELASLLKAYAGRREPAPDPVVRDLYGEPLLTPEAYADYARRTGDFSRRG